MFTRCFFYFSLFLFVLECNLHFFFVSLKCFSITLFIFSVRVSSMLFYSKFAFEHFISCIDRILIKQQNHEFIYISLSVFCFLLMFLINICIDFQVDFDFTTENLKKHNEHMSDIQRIKEHFLFVQAPPKIISKSIQHTNQ